MPVAFPSARALAALTRAVMLACGWLAVAPSHAADATPARSVEEVATELANPLAPVTTLGVQYRAEFGNGPSNQTNHTLRLQPSFFIPGADGFAVLLRTIVPLRSMNWQANASGLGDITLVPYYVPDTTKSTFVGYGAALGLPTATNDALGSSKWTGGPAVIFAKTGQPLTWGGLAQHVWSFAGKDTAGSVSVTTV